MELIIDDRQDKLNVSEELIEKIKDIIIECLDYEGYDDDYEVSLSFVDNKEIHELNKQFRGIDRPTDVLSFPMLEYENNMVFKEYYKDFKFDETYLDEGELVIGDIVLSLEKAKEQAKEYGHSFERECNYLVIHSVLHLLGYDHMEPLEKVHMREKEELVMDMLGLEVTTSYLADE